MKRLLRRIARFIPVILIASAVVWAGCEDTLTSIPGEESGLTAASEVSPELAAAFKVHDRNTDDLLNRPGVVGTGIGKNKGGQPVFVVFVESSEKARAANLPAHVEGLVVRTEVTGLIRPLRDLPRVPAPEASISASAVDPASRFDRPVPIGVSTGHPDITAGTIGARVTSGSNIYALSNNHVYADENRG